MHRESGIDIYPIKAQFISGERVVIRIDNNGNRLKNVRIRVWRLAAALYEKEISEIEEATEVDLGVFSDEFAGFGVDMECESDGRLMKSYTSFDVVADPSLSIRYGFVSDFTKKDEDNGALEWMLKCHINHVQYYDWSYRHDNLVSDDTEYEDMMGKRISKTALCRKIADSHKYGMKSIAYGAVYAASRGFFEDHRDLALYNSCGDPFVFINTFYIMNVAKGSRWCDHIAEQYKNAILKMGFDGVHMDTYGFPKKALDHNGNMVKLDEAFPGLIGHVREKLEKEGLQPCLIFNNVGNWPVYATANAPVNAVYIEVWEPYDRYCHIAEIIKEAKKELHEPKPLILAAYLKPFRTENSEAGMNAARILMGAIVSMGACHLLTGEDKAVLTQGYYSDYTRLTDKEARVLRTYYDFMIRYMELFYDNELTDVSMTHICGDNEEYKCISHKTSSYGEAGKIWTIIREKDERKVISLINLSGNGDDHWNEGKKDPVRLQDIVFEVSVETDHIKAASFASPDDEMQTAKEAEWSFIDSDRGKRVRIKIPSLLYWCVVWIELY